MNPEQPKPGSKEAIAQGCKCPMEDNHHGAGIYGNGAKYGWIPSAECMLHGKALGINPEASPPPVIWICPGSVVKDSAGAEAEFGHYRSVKRGVFIVRGPYVHLGQLEKMIEARAADNARVFGKHWKKWTYAALQETIKELKKENTHES